MRFSSHIDCVAVKSYNVPALNNMPFYRTLAFIGTTRLFTAVVFNLHPMGPMDSAWFFCRTGSDWWAQSSSGAGAAGTQLVAWRGQGVDRLWSIHAQGGGMIWPQPSPGEGTGGRGMTQPCGGARWCGLARNQLCMGRGHCSTPSWPSGGRGCCLDLWLGGGEEGVGWPQTTSTRRGPSSIWGLGL